MIIYRKPKPKEAKIIAQIHSKTFMSFFLTSLGVDFLKLYYKSSINFEEAVIVCAFDKEDNMIGFSMGTLNSNGFHKRLILSNKISFLWRAFLILLTNPKALYRLKQNLNKKSNPKDTGDYAELLSIGVLPKYKGLGIGKGLLIEFENRVKENGINKISLTTDFNYNESVINFYKSMKFDVFYEFITYPNRKMYKLIKNI